VSLILREVTREIATNFISELKNNNRLEKSKESECKTTDLWQVLLSEIAKEVVKQLKESGEEVILMDKIQINGKGPKEGLRKAEEKLSKIFNRGSDNGKDNNKDSNNEEGKNTEEVELDDLDDVDLKTIQKLEKKGVRIIYPNLKYRKPKYQNVSEVLKYVESDKEKGEGIKLVIMNFND